MPRDDPLRRILDRNLHAAGGVDRAAGTQIDPSGSLLLCDLALGALGGLAGLLGAAESAVVLQRRRIVHRAGCIPPSPDDPADGPVRIAIRKLLPDGAPAQD